MVPNCPCADSPYPEVSLRFSDFKIFLVYFFTFSHGTHNVPHCGDWMMSLSTILQWCIALTLIDAIKKNSLIQMTSQAKILIFAYLIFSNVMMIYVQNEYLVGVVISLVFVTLLWWLYSSSEAMIFSNYGPFVTSFIGHFLSWLENRTILRDSSIYEDA